MQRTLRRRERIASRVNTGVIYLVLVAFAVFCLLPFVLVVSGSLTDEETLVTKGFSIIPRKLSPNAWIMITRDIAIILNGYKVTAIVSVVGTLLSLAVTSLYAYPLSIPRLKYRNVFNFLAFITMIFYGGIVPWYIVVSKMLHLRNNLAALILPYLMNAWNMFLLRNFFASVPRELAESAKIDGAGDLRIFASIILPLSKAGLATVSLFVALVYWNDWWLGLMLIEKEGLFPLQLLLRAIESNLLFLRSSQYGVQVQGSYSIRPIEGVKMATALATLGPIVFVYPFVQKYFIKGIVIGAIKG